MLRLSPGRFNRLIANLGQPVDWRRAHACPCRDPHSGAARQGCPQCHGKGVFWEAPVAAWTGLTSMRVAREWASFGLWESGDVALTIPSDSALYGCGEFDRITMMTGTEPFSLPIDRTGEERLPFEVVEMVRCFWIDQDSGALMEASLPNLDADGHVFWPEHAARVPPIGSQYTLTGRRRLEYFIFKDLPQDRSHHGGADLPRRVAARRFDLFGR